MPTIGGASNPHKGGSSILPPAFLPCQLQSNQKMKADFVIVNRPGGNGTSLPPAEALALISAAPAVPLRDSLNWPCALLFETPIGVFRNMASPDFVFSYWETPLGNFHALHLAGEN